MSIKMTNVELALKIIYKQKTSSTDEPDQSKTSLRYLENYKSLETLGGLFSDVLRSIGIRSVEQRWIRRG